MNELRQDPISGDWVILAPGRNARPRFLEEKKKPRKPSPRRDCPFEDLEASGNWPPVFAYPEKHLLDNKWKIAVIRNKYPALAENGVCAVPTEHGMYHGMTGVGIHNLVITRDHNKNFADLDSATAAKLFEIIQVCHIMAARDECAKYVSSFFNWGPSSGASIWHPHYQILSLPIVPLHTANSLRGESRYFKEHNRCARCDIMRNEKKEKVRVIEENQGAIAIAPYTSKYPLEVSILPKKHIPSFRETPAPIMRDVAVLLQSVMKRLRKYANDPDLNFFLHDSPLDNRDYHYHHWHIGLIPKISIAAGFELSTWVDINIVDPDQAAAILRGESKG